MFGPDHRTKLNLFSVVEQEAGFRADTSSYSTNVTKFL